MRASRRTACAPRRPHAATRANPADRAAGRARVARRQGQTGRRVEPEQPADQHEPALLHAQTARHQERDAAQQLDQRLDRERLRDRGIGAEEMQREPDLQRMAGELQRLPHRQIADDDTRLSPDHPDRLIGTRRFADQHHHLAARDAIDRAHRALERPRVLHQRKQQQHRHERRHPDGEARGHLRGPGRHVFEHVADRDQREYQLADQRQLHVGDEARHGSRRAHAGLPQQAERHDLAADPRDRQQPVDRFPDPHELEHRRERWPARAANQHPPVPRVQHVEQDHASPQCWPGHGDARG